MRDDTIHWFAYAVSWLHANERRIKSLYIIDAAQYWSNRLSNAHIIAKCTPHRHSTSQNIEGHFLTYSPSTNVKILYIILHDYMGGFGILNVYNVMLTAFNYIRFAIVTVITTCLIHIVVTDTTKFAYGIPKVRIYIFYLQEANCNQCISLYIIVIYMFDRDLYFPFWWM